MAKRLAGRDVAESIYVRTKVEADAMRAGGISPTLAVVRVGEKPSDIAYENGIRKNAEKAGIDFTVAVLREDVPEEELIGTIHELNDLEHIKGILLFLPLPKGLNERRIVEEIAPEKDVDGATGSSMLRVYRGWGKGYPPCTAQAVVEILDFYGVELDGTRVAVIGRSNVVGKPLSLMLTKRNATVTICHTHTKELDKVAKEADILVSCAGHLGTVTKEHVKEGQVVVDVGINFTEEGKMTGDVSFEEVSEVVSAITPVPGGVGTVTTAVLLSHVVE